MATGPDKLLHDDDSRCGAAAPSGPGTAHRTTRAPALRPMDRAPALRTTTFQPFRQDAPDVTRGVRS